MSLFGKLLAFLNVLAVLAFFYVASIDWKKREAWADATLQHELVITGIPVDEAQLDLYGEPVVKSVRQQVLQQLLAKSGGGVVKTQQDEVKTQQDEVKRVQGAVQGILDKADTPQARAQALARVLHALAVSSSEREKYAKRWAEAANPNVKVDDLKVDEMQAEVERAFATALNPQLETKRLDGGTGSMNRAGDEKRRTIAHLLFRLVEVVREEGDQQKSPEQQFVDSKAYERFLAVVGLEAAANEINAQAVMLTQATQDVREGMAQDLDGFVLAHKRQLQQIEYLSEKVEQEKSFLKAQRELVVSKQELVKERKAQLDQLEKELATAQAGTQERLKEQTAMETNLFKGRQDQRDTFQENQKLEQKIRGLEEGR